MAEPELPPWLTQQADPTGAFLRGAQTGGVIAGVINQRSLTQSRLRLEQQEGQINHLRMEKAIKDRDDTLEADFIMQSVPEKLAPLLEAGKPADARNVLLSLAARKPAVLNSDSFSNLLKSVEAAVQTETTRLQLESLNKRATDAEAGRDYRAELSADTRLEIEQAKAILQNDPNSLVAQQRLLRAYMQMEGLQQGRERIGIAKENLGLRELGARQSAVNIESRLAESGQAPAVPLAPPGTLPPGPGGAQPATGLVVPATTPRPLTTGAATAIQAGLQKDLAAVTSLDEAIDAATAHPEAFGVQGKVRRIGEQVKGQLKPGTSMETPITDTQQKAGLAFSSIAQSLKVDSQLNRDELKMLKDIGDTMDFKESPQAALQKLNNLRSLSYRNTVRKAKQLGQLSSAIQSLPRKALVDLWKSGDLTAEQVRAESARRDTGAGPGQIEQFMRGEP